MSFLLFPTLCTYLFGPHTIPSLVKTLLPHGVPAALEVIPFFPAFPGRQSGIHRLIVIWLFDSLTHRLLGVLFDHRVPSPWSHMRNTEGYQRTFETVK